MIQKMGIMGNIFRYLPNSIWAEYQHSTKLIYNRLSWCYIG